MGTTKTILLFFHMRREILYKAGFDPAEKSWTEKLYYNQVPMGDKTIIMVGL
jgi:hypothetical protein